MLSAAQDLFEQVAETVTARAAELLGAPVVVTDERGLIVASDGFVAGSLAANHLVEDSDQLTLRIPLRLGGIHSGTVIVGQSHTGEVTPSRVVGALIELVVMQTTVVARLPQQNQIKDKFIHDLLHGPSGNLIDLLREAHILGMDFSRPRAVLLIDARDYIMAPSIMNRHELIEVRMRRRAERVIKSVVGFFDLPDDTICAYIGDGEVVVLKASSTQDLRAWTDAGQDQPGAVWANLTALKRATAALLRRLRDDTSAKINIGIGRYYPEIEGIAHSYQDAQAALSLGRRLQERSGVHCLDELGVAALVGLSDERTKAELAQHLLSPLDHAPELLETLDVFFAEDCRPSTTAGQLAIHRNTLAYRLNKITSLTGLDPRHFDDAVQVRLALMIRALSPESSE